MMDELLLQTVVEKQEDIELLVKQNNQNKTGEELKKISEELKDLSSRTMSSERINELIKSFNAYTNKLNEPVQNTIEHLHHVHKGIWIAIVLFIANIFLFVGWINNDNNTKQLRINSYKYRALKTMEGVILKKILINIDSLYKINPDFFKKMVIEKEISFSKQPETFPRMGKKERF
jgi:hypothetical protein